MSGLPERISRYRVHSVLGSGAFGVVVSAFDEALDNYVAIKVLAGEHAHDPEIRERFVREAQLLRRVRSAHVVAVHDIGELDDGRPYFVMDLASGGVLSERIAAGQVLDAPGVHELIVTLGEGLGALHAVGVIHRDVKPGNLLVIGDTAPSYGDASTTMQRRGLLANGERVVLGDLGLAKDQDRTAAGPTIVGGTPHFRAPEQMRRGADIGPAADVYAATAVLWNVLTGEPPASDALDAQLATVPVAWQTVLAKGLAADPEERYATMAEWHAAADQALADATAGMVPAITVGFRAAAPGTTCPYKGLAAFQPEDASFFFGRETLVDELVRRLHASRTLVIGGPSGSGKSSLLRAGLVPALAAGALPGSQHWSILMFSPGADALDELAHQLGRLAPDRAPSTADDLRADPRRARRLVPTDAHTLVAIDQFEELFTQDGNAPDRQVFLDALASLAGSQDASVRIAVAMRSDFYSIAAHFPWLAQCISENQVLVGPMQRQELRRAIEGPAQRAGLRLEAGLTEAFLDEAGDEPGALPLVEHALMETWLRRRGTLLTFEAFRAAGGVVGAIAQSAEHAYDRLDNEHRVTARNLFLRLVTPGENTPDTRRRLSWDEIGDDPKTRAAIDALANVRLLTIDDRGIEIVHETLIRTWPRLRSWIDESRDDLRTRQRITQASTEWDRQGREPDLLYRGAPLASALDWRSRTDLVLADLPAAFLDASRAARDAEQAAVATAERRRRRVRRIAFSTLSLLAIAAVAASVIAFTALRRSQDKEAEAEDRFARGLATQAESIATTRPKLALLLAAESAARLHPTDAEAQRAIVLARSTLSASDIVPRNEPIPVGDVLTAVLTPDGTRIVTGARDGTIRLWDTATGEPVATLSGLSGGVEEAAVDPTGRWLVAAGKGGLWRWDLAAGQREGALVDKPEGPLWSVAFSSDGARVATASEAGAVQLYNTASWEPAGKPFTANIDFLSVAFTLDGTRVLAGTGDGRVFIWNIATHRLDGPPISAHAPNDVWEIVPHPDGVRFATGGSDGAARVWSLTSRTLVASPFASSTGGAKVKALVWSADGKALYAGGDDGHVHKWDLVHGKAEDSSKIGHDDAIEDAASSRDGKVLVTLGHQEIRVWDTSSRAADWKRGPDIGTPLSGVAVNDDGTIFATSTDDGVVHVHSLRDGSIISKFRGHAGRVLGLAFLPDGRLVSGGDDGTLRLWNVQSGASIVTREHAADGRITSVAISPDGKSVASSSSNGVVRLWSASDLAGPLAETPSVGASVNEVVFMRSGRLVSANSDGMIRFWKRDGSEARPTLAVDPDGDAVFGVAVTSDSKFLAAATATDGVTLWHVDSGKRGSELNGQPADPLDVVFTDDGEALVSTNREGVVTLWNTQTGQSIGPRFEYHKGQAVWRVAVTHRSVVVTAGWDGTVALLDALDLDRACELGAGSLDRRARDRYLGNREPIGCKR